MMMRILPMAHLHVRPETAPAGTREHRTRPEPGHQGVFCLADFSIAFPVAEISCPAPAVVWQALSSGATATSESTARARMNFLYMLESLVRIRIPDFCRTAGTSGFGWIGRAWSFGRYEQWRPSN